MFLSIIIPVHNNENYIRDCLESCLNQDIPKYDYEIICVDDCSTDNSLDILREYEKKNDNIRVISFQRNKGVSIARNAGLDILCGDYCMFLDGDDFIIDNCFQRCQDILLKSEKPSILCFGRYNFQDKKSLERHDYYERGSYSGCPTERYITNRFIPCELARKFRFLEGVGYGEDEVFSLELRLMSPAFLLIDEPIYFYRMHENSAMSLTKEKRINRLRSVIASAVYVRKKYGLVQKISLRFFRERIRIAFDEILLLPLYKEIEYLIYMRVLGLITFKRIDSNGRISIFDFLSRKLLIIKKKIMDKNPALYNRIKRLIKKG